MQNVKLILKAAAEGRIFKAYCVTSKRLKGRESGVWILNSVIFGGIFRSLCVQVWNSMRLSI